MEGLIAKGILPYNRVIRTGRKHNAIRISTERFIRRGFVQKVSTWGWPWKKRVIGVLVEETGTYEMACDLPRSDSNFFGAGEYYAETETSGAWWKFEDQESADAFISKELHG